MPLYLLFICCPTLSVRSVLSASVFFDLLNSLFGSMSSKMFERPIETSKFKRTAKGLAEAYSFVLDCVVVLDEICLLFHLS